MSVKSELRKKYKQVRKNVADKKSKDNLINEFLCNTEQYKSCDTVLFYAALYDEVNLDSSIKASLNSGKRVALPVCIDNNGKMQYYYIRSLDDIEIGAFGVREPDTNICNLVNDFANAICITPAIAYDKSGYRLGYGKGYYDRFLCNFDGISIGIAYDECITDSLAVDKYDIPVDYIVTQSGAFSTAQGGKNG